MIPVVLRLFLLTQCFTFFIGCTSNPHSVLSRPRSNSRKTWLTSFLSVTLSKQSISLTFQQGEETKQYFVLSINNRQGVIFVPCYISG